MPHVRVTQPDRLRWGSAAVAKSNPGKKKKTFLYLVNASPVQAPSQTSTLGPDDWNKVLACLGSVFKSACMHDWHLHVRLRLTEFKNILMQTTHKSNTTLFVICKGEKKKLALSWAKCPTKNNSCSPINFLLSETAWLPFLLSPRVQKWKIFKARAFEIFHCHYKFIHPCELATQVFLINNIKLLINHMLNKNSYQAQGSRAELKPHEVKRKSKSRR